MAKYGTGIWGCEVKYLGGGTQIQVLYSSGGQKDVYGSKIELLVALHEAGDRMVR